MARSLIRNGAEVMVRLNGLICEFLLIGAQDLVAGDGQWFIFKHHSVIGSNRGDEETRMRGGP